MTWADINVCLYSYGRLSGEVAAKDIIICWGRNDKERRGSHASCHSLLGIKRQQNHHPNTKRHQHITSVFLHRRDFPHGYRQPPPLQLIPWLRYVRAMPITTISNHHKRLRVQWRRLHSSRPTSRLPMPPSPQPTPPTPSSAVSSAAATAVATVAAPLPPPATPPHRPPPPQRY